MKHLEIERRFLIKSPISENTFNLILSKSDAPTRIQQTYLISENDTVQRVRVFSVNMWKTEFNHFVHTSKSRVSEGINEEQEEHLTSEQYDEMLKRADPNHRTIEKTRYFIHYDNHLFELDLFEGDLTGLAILEIELASLDQPFELPPFLDIEKEITGNNSYSNYELSRKETNGKTIRTGT